MKATMDPKAHRSVEQLFSGIGRRIDELLDKTREAGELRLAIGSEGDEWRQWRDELRLQAELASMELRDALEPTIERIDLAFDHALDRADELIAASEFDADDVHEAVEAELKSLRKDLEAATANFKIA